MKVSKIVQETFINCSWKFSEHAFPKKNLRGLFPNRFIYYLNLILFYLWTIIYNQTHIHYIYMSSYAFITLLKNYIRRCEIRTPNLTYNAFYLEVCKKIRSDFRSDIGLRRMSNIPSQREFFYF